MVKDIKPFAFMIKVLIYTDNLILQVEISAKFWTHCVVFVLLKVMDS